MDREATLIQLGALRQKGPLDAECEDMKQVYIRHKRRGRERDFNHPDNPDRRLHREVHNKRVAAVKCAVDDNDPMELENMYKEQEKYNKHLRNYTQVELENAALMMRIKNIELGTKKTPKTPPKMQRPDHIRQRLMFEQVYDNCVIYKRLQNVKTEISREAHHKWHQNQLRYFLQRSKYPPYWMAGPASASERFALRKSVENPRPIVYMDIEVKDKVCHRIIFELAADVCPITAENFRSLCTGRRGKTYRSHNMDRVLPGLFWRGAGIGSNSGANLTVENFNITHDKEGVLSMVGYGSTVHSTEFMISARALPCMDRVNVAFGWVIDGMDFLKRLEKLCKPFESGKPRTPVKITNCGETSMSDIEDLEPPKLSKYQCEESALAEEITKRPSLRRPSSPERRRPSGRTIKYPTTMDEEQKQTLQLLMGTSKVRQSLKP